MDRFGRGLHPVDTEEGMKRIVKAQVEQYNRGYPIDWIALPYKKYTGYEAHRSGAIRCLWRYDGGHKLDRFLTDTLGQF